MNNKNKILSKGADMNKFGYNANFKHTSGELKLANKLILYQTSLTFKVLNLLVCKPRQKNDRNR